MTDTCPMKMLGPELHDIIIWYCENLYFSGITSAEICDSAN